MRARPKNQPAAPLRRGPAVLLGDGCLLFLVLTGALFSFLTAFSVEVHSTFLLGGCLAATLAFLGVWSLPRRWPPLPLALLAALWVLAVRRLWTPLSLGLNALRRDVINTFSASLELGFTAAPAALPAELQVSYATLFVLLFLAPLGALLGLAVVRLHSFWGSFLCSFPLLLASLCISVTPAWPPLMALVLGWAVLGLTSLARRTEPQEAARLTMAALPAAALLLTALTLAMPRETYQRPAWADRALDAATNWAVHMGGKLLSGDGPFQFGGGGGRLSQADGSVSLADAGPLRFSGRTVLEVDTQLTGRLYLRGFSGAVYDGESWAPLPEAEYLGLEPVKPQPTAGESPSTADGSLPGALHGYQPMNFPALAQQATYPEQGYARFTVRNVGADPGYVYVPYHILTRPEELAGAEFVHDAYLARPQNVWTHTLYVQPGVSPASHAILPEDAFRAEQSYAAFVHANYTAVPPQLWDVLEQCYVDMAERSVEAPLLAAPYRTASSLPLEVQAGQAVAEYLASIAVYDPNTPAPPEGADFVGWFLTGSHQGYCMHFASAATLLLRAMGIPARYVTGYVADVPSSGHVRVPDSAAHAWVEVYIDGYGWEPVEVTPAYAGGRPGQSGTAETPEATPSSAPAPSPSPTSAPSSTPAPVSTPTPEREEAGPPLDVRLLLLPSALLLLALALPLRRRLARRSREAQLQSEDTNRAVIAAYRYLLRLEPWGAAIPAPVEVLAKKAKFSPHTLTPQERDMVLSAARAAAQRVDKSLPWWKKFAFRHLFGLH